MGAGSARKSSFSGRGRLFRTALSLLVCLLAIGPPARSASIWNKRVRSSAFLYTDNLASEIGDTLTVLVSDESSFSMRGERDMQKESGHSGGASLTRAGIDVFSPLALSEEDSRTFESENEYTSVRNFVDSITVTVVDKLPNGNLVLAGRNERNVAGEEVITVLTGVVRPEDIVGGSTVSSRRIAHARIYYETRGPSSAFLTQGMLNRIMNVLWPF